MNNTLKNDGSSMKVIWIRQAEEAVSKSESDVQQCQTAQGTGNEDPYGDFQAEEENLWREYRYN